MKRHWLLLAIATFGLTLIFNPVAASAAPQVFEASKGVLAKDGVLSAENRINNSLEAQVNQSKVIVRVDQVDPNVSSVIVEVRTKTGATDLDLAHQIEKEIALALVQ